MPTVEVSGRSESFVVPDTIQLRFAVTSRGELSKATQDNAQRNGKVLDFLKSAGIHAKAVQTVSLEINPIAQRAQASRKSQQAQNPFENAPANEAPSPDETLQPKGYLVRRELSVVISPIESFEKIYTGLLRNGVNQFDSMRFLSTKEEETRFKTRIAAIRDAKSKAEAMSAELGATLEGVQKISESHQRYYGDDPFGGGPPSDAVAAGQMKISASVHVVFRLSETDFE